MPSQIEKNTISSRPQWHGPLMVSLGAGLWATDALFRSTLSTQFSPVSIVFVSHLICLFITLPLVIVRRHQLCRFTAQHWISILFLAAGGSVLAMIFFTKAFATTQNYNIPILLQKLQPIVAISLAATLLKERINLRFLSLALAAVFGAYLISFGDISTLTHIKSARTETVIYTLTATFIWGTCTVATRYLLDTHDHLIVMASRYVIATLTLFFLVIGRGELMTLTTLSPSHLHDFLWMALVPGLLALFIYYYGMKSTSASVGTLCELSFPLFAILINWLFLGSPLNLTQGLGAIILIGAVTSINLGAGGRQK